MDQVRAVIDLQFGSTGKGQIAGTMGRAWAPDTVACANGPNAGHTYQWTDMTTLAEHKIMHTVLPVTSVLPSVRNILIGPGAVVDLGRLRVEIAESQDLLRDKTIIVHPNAAFVFDRHRLAEQEFIKIGSTMKGTAEAAIEKIRRGPYPPIARCMRDALWNSTAPQSGIFVKADYQSYAQAIDSSDRLLVEGAQGHSLSIHSQFYPYCTSRDVSIHQLLADCQIPWPHDLHVVGVCRTYPIRVANRYVDGKQVGTSGGHYPDQEEISWESIGRVPELTTVTKLPRRLFTFSSQQIAEACRLNRPNSIALTFCDYLTAPGVDARGTPEVANFLRKVQGLAATSEGSVSFGPRDWDMYGNDAYDALYGVYASLYRSRVP